MGSGIAIITGGITKNPISIGGISSRVGVGRAIHDTAVAIDNYNDCVGAGDRLPETAPEEREEDTPN